MGRGAARCRLRGAARPHLAAAPRPGPGRRAARHAAAGLRRWRWRPSRSTCGASSGWWRRATGRSGDEDPAAAVDSLREALALWRGPPLADFSYAPFAQGAIVRLEELRLAAIELRVEAELALGDHARLVGELQALVREHPMRERLCGQLMLALYRDGRQTDALEAYRAARGQAGRGDRARARARSCTSSSGGSSPRTRA